MANPVEDYIALAAISKVSWVEDRVSNNPFDTNADLDIGGVFESVFGSRRDFSGDLDQFKDFLDKKCGFSLSAKSFSVALRTLADCGFIRVTDDNYAGTFVKLKSDAFSNFMKVADEENFSAAQQGLDNEEILEASSDFPSASALLKHPVFEDYHEYGDEWLSRALHGIRKGVIELGDVDLLDRPDASDFDKVPASNRLVTIDHNSKEYKGLVEQTELASESIRTSNSIQEEKRSWIRDHLDAGLELIKKHKVLTGAISALLLEPLLDAYHSVTEEPAKAAILSAIELIKSFFGIA